MYWAYSIICGNCWLIHEGTLFAVPERLPARQLQVFSICSHLRCEFKLSNITKHVTLRSLCNFNRLILFFMNLQLVRLCTSISGLRLLFSMTNHHRPTLAFVSNQYASVFNQYSFCLLAFGWSPLSWLLLGSLAMITQSTGMNGNIQTHHTRDLQHLYICSRQKKFLLRPRAIPIGSYRSCKILIVLLNVSKTQVRSGFGCVSNTACAWPTCRYEPSE